MNLKVMFKCISAMIAICLLLLFCSCHRRQIQGEIESNQGEKDSVVLIPENDGGTNVVYVPSEDGPTDAGYQLWTMHKEGDVGSYEQKSAEELADAFRLYRRDYTEENFCNFPTGILFCADNNGIKNVYYNKQTGNVSAWCPDPMCEPEECIWRCAQIMYVSRNYIYFVSDSGGFEETLYRCDLQRNNITKIADKWNLNDSIWGEIEGTDEIYVCKSEYVAGKASCVTVGKMNIHTCKYDVLLAEENKNVSIRAIIGNDIWYAVTDRETYKTGIYHTDPSFEHSELLCENFNIRVLSDEYLLMFKWDKGGLSIEEEYLYHIKTGKKTPLPLLSLHITFGTLSGEYIYYHKTMTEEEMESSPLKEYFTYAPTVEVKVIRAGREFIQKVDINNYTSCVGRIWRYNIFTGEDEPVMELTYDGLPIEMTLEYVDGDVCYFSFYTYKDFYNYYNQSHSTGNARLPQHFAKADFANGSLEFIDPYSLFE